MRFGLLIIVSLFYLESSTHAERPTRERILFLGSSSIANWHTIRDDFPEYETVQKGVGGTTYDDLIKTARHKMVRSSWRIKGAPEPRRL